MEKASSKIKSKSKDSLPLISIIVTFYNTERFAKCCIESVINQSYKNTEILLVDDGSTDGTIEVCRKFATMDNRVKVLSQENSGISASRNRGIKEATGDYIVFVDGDDEVKKDYVERLYETMANNDSDIAICGHTVRYPKTSFDKVADKNMVYNSHDAIYEILYDRNIDLSPWGKLYKKSLFRYIKYPEGKIFEDAATTYKIFDAAKRIAVIAEPLYYYKIREDSITTIEFNQHKVELIEATKEMHDYVSAKYPDLLVACERRLMYAYLSTLAQLARAKKVDRSVVKKIMKYIKKNRKKVLKDKNLPRRDRLSLRISRFGFRVFRIVWKIYICTNKRGV